MTAQVACDQLYQVYGEGCSVTQADHQQDQKGYQGQHVAQRVPNLSSTFTLHSIHVLTSLITTMIW